MPDFYMECYTELKWVKREYSLPQNITSVRQNVSKIFANRTQNSSENSKPFWRLCLGRGSVAGPTSNGKWFRGIQHTMNMVLDTRFHIWFIMTLYYKLRQILLQNARAILLQNATKIYYKMRQVFHYKMRQFYYKMRQFYYTMRQLSQIVTILLQNATVIAKCYVYYKLRQCRS